PTSTPPLSHSPTPHSLVQSSKSLYNAQRYSEANQQLHQAAQAYEEQGDRPNQAQALALQSLTLQKLGQWNDAETAIDQSLILLATLPNPPLRIRAQAFNAQGHLYFATGQAQAALTSWEAAEQDYLAAEDIPGSIGSRVNQIEALESLGLYRRASQILDTVTAEMQTLPDSPVKVNALLNLGNLLRLRGELATSRDRLTTGLSLAQSLNLSSIISQFYLSLGNTERVAAARAIALKDPTAAREHRQVTLSYYDNAITTAVSPLSQVEAQLNQLSLMLDSNQPSWQISQALQSQDLISHIAQVITQLPTGRRAIYAQINFAHRLMKLDGDYQHQIETTLEGAIAQAESLHDQRAIAHATGTLGSWYESRQEWELAKSLTNTALRKSQAIRASDLAYQWQWQMGRIIQAEADVNNRLVGKQSPSETSPTTTASPATTLSLPPAQATAIRYYSEAVATLKTLRTDLVALNPDVQFSFREQVEPVYRELVDLLLREQTPDQAQMVQARDVIEALQLAELDNFFRDACAQPQAVNLETVDPNAAVLYPILLRDRLEVVLQLPPESTTIKGTASDTPTLIHMGQPLSDSRVTQAAAELDEDLRLARTATGRIKAQSQRLYDWLIRPFEQELDLAANREDSIVKTLAFVLDGPLRNLPMSVLYDGEHYLVERYAIAVTPGLQLLDPQPLERQALNVLLGGTADAPSFDDFGFGPLANVLQELEDISITVPDNQMLRDQTFLQAKIQEGLETTPFNVVHLATHGNFSSNPEQTFILDWQQPIFAQDMDVLLSVTDPKQSAENPIELLILSACETAAGDSRAALGLAGIAIRAGARSTLATLWQVNDASTAEFMVRFYRELTNPQVTKAEALRNVQLSFLAANPRTFYNRPNRWAPFILVGNWL
ncbi:MAG: CHAT domain-containing protein, partial [Leptolyngbyaceae cyanobacterium]